MPGSSSPAIERYSILLWYSDLYFMENMTYGSVHTQLFNLGIALPLPEQLCNIFLEAIWVVTV